MELNLKESVYNRVVQDIITGDYRPGEIITERSLIEKYNCSKSPVRDALQALCADNVVRAIPRCGYEIRKITRGDVYEMLQYRYILEGGMMRSYYTRLNSFQFATLEKLNQRCREKTLTPWEHWAYNAEFHVKLMASYENAYATEELRRCLDRLKCAYAFYFHDFWDPETAQQDTANHVEMLKALKENDIDRALHLLACDLNSFGNLSPSQTFGEVRGMLPITQEIF